MREQIEKYIEKLDEDRAGRVIDILETGSEEEVSELLGIIAEDIGQLDELSKKTLGSYIRHSVRDFASAHHIAIANPDIEERKWSGKIANRRMYGIQKATRKLTKEEDESKDIKKINKIKGILAKLRNHESKEGKE